MQRTIASTAGRVEETMVCSKNSILLTQENLQRRQKIFDSLLIQQQEFLSKVPQEKIFITLPDGKIIEGISLKTTPKEIAEKISPNLAKKSLVSKVKYIKKYSNYYDKVIECESESSQEQKEDQYELIGLNTPLEGDCHLELLDFSSELGKQTFWHSSAHILGGAMEQIYGAFLTHGPPHENGYYYDSFIGEKKVTKKDYSLIEDEMKKIIDQKVQFEQLILTKEQALELFADNPFKVKLIQAKIKEGDRTSAFRSGQLIDLCTGPHIDNSHKIQAIKVSQDSSSYWLGKQNLDSLQRIYGLSFPSSKELKQYIRLQEELEQKDHKNLGPSQKLFHFHPYAPGCPFFLPHGTRIFNRLVELIKNEYFYRGFTEVITPTMFKNELWKTSGHYFKYAKDMFFSNNQEEQFGIKPMNCPSHCLMFKQSLKSYRDLPVRFADFGVLHRNEISGALTGLTRVRKFHQDDAHIFCRIDQIKDEIKGQLDFISFVYKQLGFEFSFELSTRPENFLGEVEVWNQAEKDLKEILDSTGISWKENPGDGAFYGPKIDYKVKDCFGRKHQLGTIQLDFQLPQRFNLQYKSKQVDQPVEKEKNEEIQADDEEEIEKILENEETLEQEEKRYAKIKPIKQGFERPVIIHRAILGSLERCLAILIEHYGGKWPFWLSPRQIAIIPVSQKFEDYAYYLQKKFQMKKFYVDVDDSNSTLPKRVRQMQIEGYNYMLIVGEQESTKHTVNVRKRDQKEPLGEMTIEEFYDFLEKEEPSSSNFIEQQKMKSLCLENHEISEEQKHIYLTLNKELQYKNYLEGEGIEKGKRDEEIWENLKDIKLDANLLPNLYRWQKMMSKIIKQFNFIMNQSKSTKFDINIIDCDSDQLGELFAVCSTEGKILIFLQNKSSKMEEILEIKEHKSCVWKVKWSDFRIGNLLATCSFDGTIKIWKITKCPKEQRYQYEILNSYEGTSSVNSIDWSPLYFGSKIAGCDSEGSVIILSKQGSSWKKKVQKIQQNTEPLNSIVWMYQQGDPENDKEDQQKIHIITGGCDGYIYFLQYKDEVLGEYLSMIHKFEAHKNWIRDISLCPHQNLLYFTLATASEDKTCKIWKFKNDNKEFYNDIQEISFDSPVWRVNWNSTGHLLSIGYTSQDRKNMVQILSESEDGSWKQIKILNNQ